MEKQTYSQEYFNEFVNSTKYNEYIKEDCNNLLWNILKYKVKPLAPEMQAKATNIHSAWQTFDGMWLDFPSKKGALKDLIDGETDTWNNWVKNRNSALH